MKIAAISDIHGNLNALQAVLAEIDREGVDQIINCGDTLGGPLESAKTADLLMARGIPMIAGNHERQLLTLPPDKLNRSDACTASEINDAHRAWLASAPPTMWFAEDVFICHGTPASDLHYWLETITDDFGQNGSVGVRPASHAEILERLGSGAHTCKASLIICGHTHVPRVVQVNSPDAGHPITIVNAGSVGLPGYDDIHPHKHWIETGSPHARYALIEKTPHGWNVQLRSVAYDFERMAQLAERRKRPDWARPLRTGRMS
ncbi:metallophosphoesterase family protein [Variovorax sp. PCZ-1]|uniref:metallophosphoesterase family protein n=1 Tax=Variovorax sp. PCZ-1 TaxID=2835533 RepID=UPI001BCAE288|nr:metallophosphoesterase family protein [Variovorax sp. PCZ-1]MBS7808758.1 metallophosphoesterase family protein [Variovorax sp. PCZ-1]